MNGAPWCSLGDVLNIVRCCSSQFKVYVCAYLHVCVKRVSKREKEILSSLDQVYFANCHYPMKKVIQAELHFIQ